MKESDDFFKLCRKIGSQTPIWVQGAGGNVSQKINDSGQRLLRIKASGYRLDQVCANQGFVDLDYDTTANQLEALFQLADGEKIYAELLSTGVVRRAKPNDRASMETGFHLAIKAPFVAHFHSLVALLLADLYFKKDPKARHFMEKLGCDLKCCFIEYVKPGLDLSYALKSAGPADVYFLKNHGVILALQQESDLENWVCLEKKIIAEFFWQGLESDSRKKMSSYWPLIALMPDTVVFMDKLLAMLEADPQRPGFYRLTHTQVDPSLLELWLANICVMSTLPEVESISPSEWEAISGMPAEKYRQSLQTALSKGLEI